MLSLLGGLLTAGSGGLFGILGSIATTFLKQRGEQKEFERDMKRQEMQIKVAAEKGSWDGLQSSQQMAAEVSKNSNRWSNDVKNLFRPFITTLVIGLNFYVFLKLLDMDSTIAKLFGPAEIVSMLKYYVNSMIFAGSAALMWWFGDRAQKPPGLRNL
ncbi:MAG: hypothetical protein JRD68_00150 [Deltaproteobacteria bacterium]|nr:hypothetical protein [Deltaproteobacteria bacterium]